MNHQEGNTSVATSSKNVIQAPPSLPKEDSGNALSSPGVNDLKKKLWGSSPDGKTPSLNQWQHNSSSSTPLATSSTKAATASSSSGVNDLKKKLWGSSPDGTNSLNQWQGTSTSTPTTSKSMSSPASTSNRSSVSKLQDDLWGTGVGVGGGDENVGDRNNGNGTPSSTTPTLRIRHDNNVHGHDDVHDINKEEKSSSFDGDASTATTINGGDKQEQKHYQNELVRLHWWINNGKLLVQQVQNGEYNGQKLKDIVANEGTAVTDTTIADENDNINNNNLLVLPSSNANKEKTNNSNKNNDNVCLPFVLFRNCFK